MTEDIRAVDPDAPLSKAPAPGLSLRTARPPVVRLRKSAVQALIATGAILVSGSLAWAFVIQPDLRDRARLRAVEDREDGVRVTVRPSVAVTDQPASYDRLPEPRGVSVDPSREPAALGHESAPVRARRSANRFPGEGRDRGADPQDLATRSGLFFETDRRARVLATAEGTGGGPATAGLSVQQGVYNPNRLVPPVSPFELKAGAVLSAALLSGVDTARPGPVVATVTQNVFDSVAGRHLLVPQGARLIGRHEGESAYGDRRAFLVWERLILPNGKSLVLDAEPGVDAQGAIGVQGEVDRRLLPLLVGTLFAGAITTLGLIARDDAGPSPAGLLGDAGDAAAIEGARVGGRLIDRELEVRPSIRLRPGAAVRVLITRDLVLEPYVS